MDSTSPGSQLKSSITDASRKIEGIIDDAERAAAEIKAEARAEAERESRRAISESAAQLASVVDPLVKRVENLRVEAAALMHELEAATLNLVELTKRTGESGTTVVAPPPKLEPVEASSEKLAEPRDESPSVGPAPIAYPGRGATASPPTDPPEEAVLRATQMAVAGSSRSEIEATLRDEFDLEDATPVVNDILGDA